MLIKKEEKLVAKVKTGNIKNKKTKKARDPKNGTVAASVTYR